MSNGSNNTRMPLRSRMVFRLWSIMMVLVILSIVFMWVSQIFLFERDYIDSAIQDVQTRIEPIMEDLGGEDLANSDKLISYLSKSVNGKMMLVDGSGELIAMYSNGHRLDAATSTVWQDIKDSEEFQKVLQGEQYKKILRDDTAAITLEIGIPVTYDGEPGSIILYRNLDEINMVLRINRRQLVWLSVLLTLAASLLAAVFSRHFTRPIQSIRRTVRQLAQGELDAAPGIQRRDEIGALSQSVEELGQELQRVDVLRKEVIANVSHELRSPLALITGYSEMVRDISWQDDQAREENLNLIMQEAGRLSEMVDDIMDYSQFQAGYVRLKRDWYNLYEIVESEIAHCAQNAAKHGIDIRLESECTDIPLHIDALKLSRVLRNLLYNAINHTDDNGRIVVRIEKNTAAVTVRVSNPGTPIPVAEREAIWERYYRVQHQGGRRQGSGLGLSIVSTILTAHGMTYGVDCQDGITTFWFACPEEQQGKDGKKGREKGSH